ncbi:MAG: biotin--[acetyl-CoA-carboxylase] ligase [Lachnospiraceae bacterium]|nr:biotin--[acetyl-CoA-carboxylase] ligase [Lachnospiraceae bacterium]MEE3461650.1 biotin--[acetyl-CoA-carboxylase] ligase [Lachnospiraceae bacterium]
MGNRKKIIDILRDNQGSFVSSSQMVEELGVSRQAVWKAVNSLEKEAGFNITSIKGRGYKLEKSPLEFNAPGIEYYLDNDLFIDYKVRFLKSTDSTNTRVIDAAGKGASEGYFLAADEQTGGKGRRGRSFLSPAGVGIFMSLLLKPSIAPSRVSCVTLLAALAVRKAIEDVLYEAGLSKVKVGIKWPNDIIIDGKKICGILTQMNCEKDYINYLVTGIGINVNNKEMPESIRKTAASLFMLTGKKFDRNKICAYFLNYFADIYGRFSANGDMSGLKKEYDSVMIDLNNEVRVYYGMVEDSDPEKIRNGKALGIDSDGSLLVDFGEGPERVSSGEVSVRGVY